MGVGVTVGVAVLVGVTVGVLVTVGVGVKVTQVPKSQTPELQGRPDTGTQDPRVPVEKQTSHTPQGGMQPPPPMKPALARVPANTSTTSTASPMRFMATVIPEDAASIKSARADGVRQWGRRFRTRVRCWGSAYRFLATRRTDHNPANNKTEPINAAV